MAWGYSPRPVVKSREASLDSRRKGPGFLLIIVGICASLFVFGLVTEILKSTEQTGQDSLMIKLNDSDSEVHNSEAVFTGATGNKQNPVSDDKELDKNYKFGKLRWMPVKGKKKNIGDNLTTYEREEKVEKPVDIDGDTIR